MSEKPQNESARDPVLTGIMATWENEAPLAMVVAQAIDDIKTFRGPNGEETFDSPFADKESLCVLAGIIVGRANNPRKAYKALREFLYR